MKRLTITFALFILAIIVVADLGWNPGDWPIFQSHPHWDKLGHFVLMGVMAWLLNRYLDPPWALESRYVPVRDGTRLAVDIYRPAQWRRAVEMPLPVLWTLERYHRARYLYFRKDYRGAAALLDQVVRDEPRRSLLQTYALRRRADVRFDDSPRRDSGGAEAAKTDPANHSGSTSRRPTTAVS